MWICILKPVKYGKQKKEIKLASVPRNVATPKKFSKRREVILERALVLFSERGLESTGLKEIAKSLNLTHPALYHYFSSKEQLVFEAVQMAVRQMIAAITENLETVPHHASLRLASLVRAQVNQELEGKNIIPFVNAYLYGPARDTAKLTQQQRDEILSLQRQLVDLYRREISNGQTQGEFVKGSASVMAFGILGIVSYAVFWFREGGTLTARQIAEQLAMQSVRSVSITSSMTPTILIDENSVNK